MIQLLQKKLWWIVDIVDYFLWKFRPNQLASRDIKNFLSNFHIFVDCAEVGGGRNSIFWGKEFLITTMSFKKIQAVAANHILPGYSPEGDRTISSPATDGGN